MKGLVFALGMVFLCGCSFIVAEDQDISSFGMKKDEASSLTREIQRQRPQEPPEVKLFRGSDLK